MSIEEQIAECKKRKKEYMRLIKDIELMRLAYARSIATETLNIASLKKQLKEQKNEHSTGVKQSE